MIIIQTPAGTLPPPTPPPGVTQTPIIVPVTGAESSLGSRAAGNLIPIFLNVGIGLLGFGLVALGISQRLNRNEEDLGDDLEKYLDDDQEEDLLE